MSQWNGQWQRRSSSMRGRPSHDPSRNHGSRQVERNSRIPLFRSSSAQSNAGGVPHSGGGGGSYQMVRSKSTLGSFTPQEKMMSSCKITPQPATPMIFGGYSSKKKMNLMKEQRNLHDKEFLKEAYYLVLEYFRTNQPTILLKDDIRPMSIKMFLEMVNHLMSHIELYHTDSPIEFTPINYEVEIPHWLKYIEYPGQVSKGWMKTVNAPHSWPNVIGLLSWLVKLAKCVEFCDSDARVREIAENSQRDLMSVQYTLSSLSVFNTDDDEIAECCAELVEQWSQILGCTDEAIEQLELENGKMMELLDDPEDLQEEEMGAELEQKLVFALTQNKKGLEDIKNMKEAIVNLKLREAKKERNCATLIAETKQVKQESEQLKNTIETQQMSSVEYTEIKQKCETLAKEISNYAKESDENRQIIFRCDHEINTKRDKILQCESSFNRQVIQLEQKVPEMQGLRARTNPDSADVVEDLEKLLGKLNAVKERLLGEYRECELMRTKLDQNLNALKERSREVAAEVSNLHKDTLSKKQALEELELNAHKEEEKLAQKVKNLKVSIQSYEDKETCIKKLSQDIAAKKEELALYESAQKLHEKKCEEQWERIAELTEQFEGNILEMKEKLDRNQTMIEGEINELMDQLLKHRIVV